MNIQQFYDEKERKEQEQAELQKAEQTKAVPQVENDGSTVISVVQEQAHIHKQEVETGKVRVQKKVLEIEKSIDIPLKKEGYEVITPVLVTNVSDYKDVLSLIDKDVKERDELIKVIK